VNFKHLRYFWTVAKAGGVMRAAEQLNTTPQTLSGQIKLLEESLGYKLFQKSGGQLELTDEGRLALGYADEIFALGPQLENSVRQAHGGQRTLEFRVGVADSVAKSVAYHLLEPALGVPQQVRLICHEGKFEDLLARLALHRLDLVIADERLPSRVSVKAFNHPLGASFTSFVCSPALKPLLKGSFPQCLDGVPMLIHGASSALRRQFDQWLARLSIRPEIIAEFDDGAIMNAFGREGRGVFMTPTVLEAEIKAQYGASVIGRTDELMEKFFAISVEQRMSHPCVAAITHSARAQLFSATSL
jgi:LysR family transcriptional activator of nhaA